MVRAVGRYPKGCRFDSYLSPGFFHYKIVGRQYIRCFSTVSNLIIGMWISAPSPSPGLHRVSTQPCFCPMKILRSQAQLPAVTLTRMVDRERYKPAPAPVSVMAVSDRATRSGGSGGGGGGGGELGEKLSTSVRDYFADDLNL